MDKKQSHNVIAFYRRQANPKWETEIATGARVIEKLLQIYPELQQERNEALGKPFKARNSYKAAMMLTHLKQQMRKRFPGKEDAELLKMLAAFDEEDYRDLLENFKQEGKT